MRRRNAGDSRPGNSRLQVARPSPASRSKNATSSRPPIVRRKNGRGYLYRRRSPWLLLFGYLAVTLASGGAVLIAIAFGSALLPPEWSDAPAQLVPATPLPSATLPAPRLDAAHVQIITLPRPPTQTQARWLKDTVPPPSHTPDPVLTALAGARSAAPTLYLAVPANPTPIPTPALPPAAPFPTSCDGPGRMNILLIGLDGRSGNYQRPARADAIAVLGINFGDRNAQLLSIPRDLWVPLPGLPERQRPEGKINTAYVWGESDDLPGGGPGYLAAVITWTFNLRIDRFAVINFSAFEGAVDAIGGVDIDVPRAIHDTRYPVGDGTTMVVDIPAGPVHMDGATALIYARTRHQDGDFARMRRQQAVLMAIRDGVLSPEAIPYLPSLAQALYGTLYTDLSLEDIGLLGCIAPQISREAIQRLAVDNTMVYGWKAPNGESALQPKMDAIEPMLQVFNAGQ